MRHVRVMGSGGSRRRRGLIVLVITAGVALLVAPAALGATFTVVNTNDSGAGSLRQAILDSNGNVGVVDTIDFNIALPGEQVITPATALPVVTDAAVIDGSTQVDGSGFPLIRIDASPDTPSLYGLELNVTGIASSTVRKLAFTRWDLGNGAGLYVHNTGTALVTGNLFGTDAAGTAGLGNYAGLFVQNGSTVGGTTADERNVASGNVTGMAVNGPASIFGNYFGLTPAGTAARPNGIQGILVAATAATIGGAGPGQGNVISGNSGFGVRIVSGSSNTVKGNRVGTGPFAGDFGNGGVGVSIFGASGNTVGGTVAVGDGNVIAFNSRGVVVESGTGNAIRGNDISDNDGLGIDLGPGNGDGVTLNDPAPDDDLGPNNLQNYPVLTSAVVNPGLMTVSGGLTSAPNTTYSIDVFTTPTCDPASPADGLGHGEGGFYNGRFNVTTDGAGTATFSIGFGFGGAPGQAITATATDPAGNTSEFSACVISTAGDDVAPTVSLTAPAAGSVLRGTVAVAADASDNVGVESVAFKYFTGALPYVNIATDTTPPYEATFDSTTVANTLPRAGTVYAFARDAAGNETGVGNAVMVDNPPSRIVFESDRDGDSEIYSVDPNGFDLAQLTTSDAAVDTRPALSPDGSLIAWQRGDEIWLMNSNGTNQQALTSLNRDAAPAFSPDGTKIAFERDPPGDMNTTHDIWVMNVDGTNLTNLTNVAGNDVSATWSPDGTKLAFDSDRSGNRDIFTMNADGTGQTGVAWNSPQIDVDPDWSPDGQKLLFASGRGGGGTVVSVWSANADGSGSAVNVTNATIFDADPAWSPDGTRIVFTRDAGGQTFNLHMAAADGTTAFPPQITFAGSTQRNSFADWGSLVTDLAQPGPVFTVTTADDHDDAEGCTDADCTLREAIDAANARPNNADYDPDEIHFAILGSGPHTITPQPENGPLPPITEKVILDGTTQTGFVAEPPIVLDGSALICIECINHDGIRVTGGVGTTIRGLAIVNFDHRGIVLAAGSSNSIVEGSWIGIDQFGPGSGAGNALGGIRIEGSAGNRIGGPLPEQRVSLGANGNFGGGQIEITGLASGNVVQGSYIGLNPDGAFTYDTEDGVLITSGASGNTIGGDGSAGEGNVVYGFYGRGVVLDGAGADNVIAGNTIGLSEDGAIGEAPEVGIDVVASPENDIGDSVSPPGFANPSRGNVVVGADTVGIRVGGGSGGTRMAGNFVGVHRSISSVDFGNFDGIVIVDSGVTVGPGNTIAFNTANGVEIDNEVSAGNRIVANSIHDNGLLGIDLQSFANNGLAAPTITSATTAGAATTVDGTVTAPAGTYFVEFFTNTSCDGPAGGEGETYVGFATAVVSGPGTPTAPFTQDLPALPAGTVLTATTTSGATNDTSEFSTCATVTAGTSDAVVTLEPAADTYVDGAATETNFGAADYFDTYGGFSASCVPHSAPAYGLLRFNLSSLPAGQIADAKIVLTSRAGYAQDGDGNHHVIRLSNDSWGESTVNWTNRPSDGTVTPGDPLDDSGNDIRLSRNALGADFVWRNSCNTDFAGNQTKVFPTNSNWTKTLAAAQADMIAAVTEERAGDDLLSVEVYNPNCVSCPAGANKAYWARYYSREAEDAALRPKLVVTYGSAIDVTSFTATPANPLAGVPQVDLADVPTSVLLAAPSSTASTPLGDTPLGDTPLGDTPLGDTPLGDTPLGDTSLGLGDLVAELRTVPLESLPLLRDGGWPAVLANTPLASRALQNVNLGEVLDLTPPPAVLDGVGDDDIRLEELDFSRSPLGDVAMIAFALGNGVLLSELPGLVQDDALTQWCTLTATSCSTSSVLALGLQGAPLGDTPLGDTPLGDTPLGDTPLGDTPLADTPLGDTPLADTPLGDTPLGDTDLNAAPLGDTPLGDTPLGDTRLDRAPLGDTPLGDTPLGDTPLGDTPLGDTPLSDVANCEAIFTFSDCSTRGGTLDDHFASLRPDVTIANLVAALTTAAAQRLTLADLVASLADPDAFTVAQLLAVLEPASAYTLAQVAAIFTASSGITLNDLLLAVLRAGAQWERIDITQPALARVATGGGAVSLRADLTVPVATVLTFAVDLPPGWTVPEPSFPTISSLPPPGAISLLDVVSVTPIDGGGTRHTLRTPGEVSGSHRFSFEVIPGTTLGPASPSLAVTTAGGTEADAPPTSVTVQETFEPNNDAATAPALAVGTFYLSYLTSAADTDYFRFNVPAGAGTRTTFRLSHLPGDYDLVVYGPSTTPQLVEGGDAAPLETPVLGDSGAPITHLTESLPAETLDDLTLLTGRPVLGVSAFRTTEDEAVVAISDGAPGEYVVQVTGYNGATSVEPYMLRVETEAPRLAPTCVPRFPGLSFGSAGGVSLPSIPTDVDTVFLANGPQLAAMGGQSVLNWFSTANLGALRNTGHPSALVRLEDDPDVRAAYVAWNAQPCSTARANAVVRAITGVLADIRAARPTLRNVVLLGADTAIPFARLDDLTTIANEAGYASTFGRADDLYGALFEHRVLSDDPYGTTDPIPYLQRQLFVPQQAVGRLVETPAQITGTLDRFVAFDGVLDPSSARTSGYDFLKDGANGVAAAFADIVGAPQLATNPPLIGDLWTRATLAGALSTNTGLFGMNGHADHGRLQPARGDADGDGVFEEEDLFSAADLPLSLERAVVFSMGCHSGLSASDASVAGAAAADWAQAFAGKGAAAYAGNLGYGYGDTVTVAYSEALNVRLAEGLRDGLPIGEALVEAKQGYLAGLGLVGIYDEKAMSELALYGLPMWSLASGAAAAAATEAADEADELVAADLPAGVTRLSTDTDPVTGLVVDRYRSQPTLTPQPVTGPFGGTYWTGPSGVEVKHLRPLQPKAQFEVAEDAHGLLITALESSDDHSPMYPSPINPVYARPIVDSSATEPELPFADVAFPAKIQSLVSQRTRTGRRASAVLVQGQFFSDDVVDANGAGVQRLFTRVDLDVLRSAGTDRLAPRLDSIEATVLPEPELVSFSVDAVDLPGAVAGDVIRVLVAFRDETSPTWRFLDLARGTGSVWGGGASVSGERIEYFVQAVDRAGNVAVSTNKGLLFAGAPAPELPPAGGGVEPLISPSVGGTQIAGWFKPAAVLDIEADDGVAVAVSIDGGAFTPVSVPAEVPINGDGLHTVDVVGSNGYEATLLAPVDSRPPTVVLDQPGATVPLNGGIPLAFRCADTASGVASCTAKVDGTTRDLGFLIPTTPLNSTHSIVLTAIDRVGFTTTQTFTYTVRSRGIVYSSSATGSGDIYTLPADAVPTTVPTRLTATSFPEADPVQSPDSRRIAFSSNRDGTWGIYFMDADGTDVTQLPTGTGDATEPAWSPDGTRIAFVSTRSGNADIWVVNLNGSGLTRLTTDTKLDVSPAWAPNARIAWSNGPGGQLDIWSMTATGGSKTRLTTTEDLNTYASWASDGTIAFARRAKGTARFEIWTMTSGGKSQVKIIVSNARNDIQPTWLQDGKIVFASDRDTERDYDLFRATKAKTSWPQVRVTDAPGDDLAPNG